MPAKPSVIKISRMVLPARWVLMTITIVLALCAIPGDSFGAAVTVVVDTTAFIDQACLRYGTEFEIAVPPTVWERVIAHPLLLGMLWGQYGFEPPYTFESVGWEVHVDDGSGLEGYLSYAGGDAGVRVLLARGRLRNWGLPIGVKGRALFILRWQAVEGSVQARLAIYGEGTGSAADIVIRAFSPILSFFINRRIKANLRDVGTILSDIVDHPNKVRDMLAAEFLPEFDSMLNEIQLIRE